MNVNNKEQKHHSPPQQILHFNQNLSNNWYSETGTVERLGNSVLRCTGYLS